MACLVLHPMHENGEFTSSFSPHTRDSILIYLTVGGSVIPMHILETDSIALVKLRIQTLEGFFVKKPKLVFEGKELAHNNSCVGDYGVADGNVLHLVLRLSDFKAITVRTLCGKEFGFYVEKTRNVGYVKQQIAKKGQGVFDLADQELVWEGEALEDQRLIDDICKDNDAVIHLLVRISDTKVRTKPAEKGLELSIEASFAHDTVPNLAVDQLGPVPITNRVLNRNQLTREFILN